MLKDKGNVMKIQYRANARKVLESLVWIASRRPGNGFHFILKVLFYADKYHLQQYGRPVTGDTYVKMSYGPVASLAYDMLKKEERLPQPVLEEINEALDVQRDKTPMVFSKRDPEMGCFSETDEACLQKAMEFCDRMDFGTLTKMTHEEPAWQAVDMNAAMDYELFVDADIPDREELIAYIRETAPCLAL
ncbi:MAG: Panacea domain-containing protein [Thermodesulfobacteriota bacterium]